VFFLLSKILSFVLMPVLWVLAAFGAALIARTPRRRLQWLRAGIVLLMVLTNPLLSNQAWRWWEVPAVPVAAVGHYDAAILLTGITEPARAPHDRVYMGLGADRLLHTVWLYRRGCFRRIIVSGGSGAVVASGSSLSEAAELRQVLLSCGVPDSVIVLEDQSRNTHENAVRTAALLASRPPNGAGRYLLITSAFHMRRAAGCFRKAGVPVDVFPADFTSLLPQRYTPDASILPNELALTNWNRLIHEIAGYLTYRLAGYC
jgi:uncharacterized SAM-binding protein YcdF (DUF218 family)